MVDEVAASTRIQPAGPTQQEQHHPSDRPTIAQLYMKALNDAVTLSPQAQQVMNSLSRGQTIAEAWLQQLTTPPDLTQPHNAPTTGPVGTDGGESSTGKDVQAAMRQSMNRAMSDLSWLFDAMSPPRVDTGAIAQALAERMAADNVGTSPPQLDQVIASAEQAGTTPVMYIENLSVTVGHGGTTASVDRVTLTTVDPSLVPGSSTGDRPVVLDVGGEAKPIPEELLLPGEKKLKEAGEPRSLLVVRQGGTTRPEGTLHVKLDVLLPIG